ncbi:MAG TPA: BTAD domain-containing putative transcriptional regulator [Anaerolineales bacterium]|nr:BTAD domain-containing putative transcriptional regulator [Anaerolineales bacterium]
MDALYISGMGPPQISLNGKGVEIKRRKAIALLVYLAVEGRSQSREFLSGLFWPEYDQSSAYAYLRRTLWEIKNVLGDGWLEVSREWIGIPSSTNFQMDVIQFQALLRGVKEHDHPIAELCEQCIGQLEAAIRLYRGDFLSGFSLSACPQFDAWQFLQSELIRRMFQDTIQDLVNVLEQHGRISESIPYAQRWLAIDNLNERAHRKLMTLFAKDEQIHTALRQFEVCQTVLKTELDLAPEIETTDLYNQIRERRSSAPLVETGQTQILLTEGDQNSWLEQILSSPVRISFQTNLPVQTTRFFGRETEIRKISGLLHNPDCWLLALIGMGGIGKTRLANQVGQEINATFPDGVYFVTLEGLKSISALVHKIAETLGLSFHPQKGSPGIQLNSFLRDKTLLIIFDNFETLISEAAILHQLHAEATNLKFLATSRERLKISGEWVFEIQGLDYPELDPGKFDEILGFPAVELFIHVTRQTLNNFQIDVGNYREIVAIVQLLEGMPLGLEMAASWMNLLSPKEILAEIRTNLDFLKTEMQDTPTRQQSMRAVLDYSWKRLNCNDQSAISRLSVFQGGFNRESAGRVARVSLVDLKRLMDRSFLRKKGSGGFYLHGLMRQYALEKLRQSPENYVATRDRHAAYYIAALSLWGERLKGPEQVDLLPVMRREIDNLQATWVWVAQEEQIEQIQRGLEGLCYFYLRTLRNQEGLEACQLGLAALEEAETECGPEVQANLLAWKSIFCLNLDDHETAGESIDSGLKMMGEVYGKRNDLAPLWARLLMTKAIIENYLGNREKAIEYYDRAFTIYWQLQDFSSFSYLMLHALDIGGVTSEKSYQFLSDAIHFKRKSGDFFNTAYLLYMYCMVVAYHFGQPFQATVLMQESCEIFERLGDPLSKEMSLVAVDPILNINGRYDELLGVRKKKIDYAQERGDHQTTGIYLAEVAETLCHLGNYPAAEEHFREALIHIKDGTSYQYAFRLCGLGEVLLVQGKISESQDIFQESISGIKIGEKWGQGKAYAGLSMATFKIGNREKAWELIGQALRHHHEGQTHYFSHFSLGAYAYLLSQEGDIQTALEIYSMLEQQMFIRDSRWFKDLYRKPIYAVAMDKDPDENSEAESIGRQMDLWKTLEQVIQKVNM